TTEESEEAEVPAESSEVEEPETTETSEETVEEPEATEETTTEESEEAEVPAESSEVEVPETTETSEEVVEAPEPSTPVEENIQPEAPESSEPETPNNDNQGNSGNQGASQPTDVSQPKEETSEPSANADSSAILAEAQKHMGTPYVWGGRTPDGFDCSGFTQYVYKQVTGKDIGGYTVPQENAGPQISASQAKPGDLLFWGSKGSTYHVAISMGGSSFIHAPKPGDTVKVGDTQYFTPDFAVSM
ncbi:MAG: NlpC/P60 family protein, partial [Tetragenococcus halophilus]|nr:NlpC/P60 family protein [Tetragenococcus halophilus]MDN6848136.1 NlpC/P60 family protein [Tetragenococcus koreensis]MDN6153984.1 NlpC/P60 family protein [Tetragenococcus halophilus]MDN6186480.1 NlpC/P60 family protein [Tetragenococcus halophilus]MDN6257934.1 NlpC/P60 family protein [Tetragenococcus halophilus]